METQLGLRVVEWAAWPQRRMVHCFAMRWEMVALPAAVVAAAVEVAVGVGVVVVALAVAWHFVPSPLL